MIDSAGAGRIACFGGDYVLPNGYCPAEKHSDFMSWAVDLAENGIDANAVERIADALLAKCKLDKESVLQAFGTTENS